MFQTVPLSGVLHITNIHNINPSIWMRAESDVRLCWIRLHGSDNYHTTITTIIFMPFFQLNSSINFFLYQSARLASIIWQLIICLSASLPIYLSVCRSVCLFIYKSIYLSIYLCLSIYLHKTFGTNSGSIIFMNN